MKIQRIIVEDITGRCVSSNPLSEPTTENEIMEVFKQGGTPIRSINVDSVGVALVKVWERLPGSYR